MQGYKSAAASSRNLQDQGDHGQPMNHKATAEGKHAPAVAIRHREGWDWQLGNYDRRDRPKGNRAPLQPRGRNNPGRRVRSTPQPSQEVHSRRQAHPLAPENVKTGRSAG